MAEYIVTKRDDFYEVRQAVRFEPVDWIENVVRIIDDFAANREKSNEWQCNRSLWRRRAWWLMAAVAVVVVSMSVVIAAS